MQRWMPDRWFQRQTERHKVTETDRQTDRQKGRWIDIVLETDRYSYRQTDRQAARWTDRLLYRNRKIDGQIDNYRDRDSYRDRQGHTNGQFKRLTDN